MLVILGTEVSWYRGLCGRPKRGRWLGPGRDGRSGAITLASRSQREDERLPIRSTDHRCLRTGGHSIRHTPSRWERPKRSEAAHALGSRRDIGSGLTNRCGSARKLVRRTGREHNRQAPPRMFSRWSFTDEFGRRCLRPLGRSRCPSRNPAYRGIYRACCSRARRLIDLARSLLGRVMRVHDRRPAILGTEAARRWLEPGPRPAEVLVPYPAREIKPWCVCDDAKSTGSSRMQGWRRRSIIRQHRTVVPSWVS